MGFVFAKEVAYEKQMEGSRQPLISSGLDGVFALWSCLREEARNVSVG